MNPLGPSAPGASHWSVGRVPVGARSLEMKQISLGEVLSAQVEGTPDPWWAHVWPAGLRLAEYVLAAPPLAGRTCLDLGTGSGIVGIALGLQGARVTFADFNHDALALAGENARRSGLRDFELLPLDWRAPPPRQFDEVYAADVAYDATQVSFVARALGGLVARGGSGLLADPRRTPLEALLAALPAEGLAPTIEHEEAELVFVRLRCTR